MVANLQGVRFDQIYGDNSGTGGGQTPFDSDGDGSATQEDEFVSITNDNATPLDISGWQIWSDSTGSGAPDKPQDGLYHTFPSGTVLQPGQTLYIINEISGPAPNWAQEASEGGVESGSGGQNTNLLTEGSSGSAGESIALVDPVSGDYIVFNMSTNAPNVQNENGFPGTTNIGTEDGHAVMPDQPAGTAYRFNSNTGSYEQQDVAVPCFAAGTRIHTPKGWVPVEELQVGDMVLTADAGPQPIRWRGHRLLNAAQMVVTRQHPIEFKPGSLGPGLPARTLRVSPQHRILMQGDRLVAARGLTDLPKVRVMQGCRQISYHHLLLDRHHVIFAEGVATESLLPGRTFLARCSISDRLEIMRIAGAAPEPARPCLTVAETRRSLRDHAEALPAAALIG
ncbi:Hint domain-containing protein [Roseobacter sp. A03A-229]